MYKYESELITLFETFATHSQTPFSGMHLGFEFNYDSGKTDIIASTSEKDVLAFEAKLTRWRDALSQAYRNTCFAHYSYVILPTHTAEKALRRCHEFERLGVGLCSIDPSGVQVIIIASRNEPLLPWLTDKALGFINQKDVSLTGT